MSTDSRIILAVDPGFKDSAYVLYEPQSKRLLKFGKVANEYMLGAIKITLAFGPGAEPACLVIEQIAAMGMAVGEEVFETVFWTGRFAEAWGEDATFHRLKRRAIKQHLCYSDKAKDANIRQALIDLFGGDSVAIGGVKCPKCKGKGWCGAGRPVCTECGGKCWKHTPGPLHGVTADVWSALAIAVTFAEGAGQ